MKFIPREDWRGRPLAAYAPWAILALLAVWARIPSQYDYVMAYNEWHYANVALGRLADPWLPPFYASLAALIGPVHVVGALRLVSIASSLALAWIVQSTLGPKASLAIMTLPWLIIWGSRAQTDALMTLLAVGGLLVARSQRVVNASFVGGFMVGLSAFAKPPGLIAALGLPWREVRCWMGFLLGLVPFGAWALSRPQYVWDFHASSSSPFGNFILNTGGVFLGLGVLAGYALMGRVRYPTWVIPPMLGFLGFAFWKAPIGHEYYLLPGLVLPALGDWRGVPTWMFAFNAWLGLGLAVWFMV